MLVKLKLLKSNLKFRNFHISYIIKKKALKYFRELNALTINQNKAWKYIASKNGKSFLYKSRKATDKRYKNKKTKILTLISHNHEHIIKLSIKQE